MPAKEKHNKLIVTQSWKRFSIAAAIIILGTVNLYVVIWRLEDLNHNTVFTAVVGLTGSWVGTVLTFYFSKENFDAANKNTQEVIDKIAQPKDLTKVTAGEAMIPLKDISFLQLKNPKVRTEDNIDEGKLIKLLGAYLTARNRLPILTWEKHPKHIVHRSLIDRFITEKMINEEKSPNNLTLEELVESEDFKLKVNAFVTVKESDHLEYVRIAMDNARADSGGVLVSDAFVTQEGGANSPVLGWITNSLILEKSRV